MKLNVEILAEGASITDTAGTFTVESMADLRLLYRLVALANRYPREEAIVCHSKPSHLLIYTQEQDRHEGLSVTPVSEGLSDEQERQIESLLNV